MQQQHAAQDDASGAVVQGLLLAESVVTAGCGPLRGFCLLSIQKLTRVAAPKSVLEL
jgi:hypothetical protein